MFQTVFATVWLVLDDASALTMLTRYLFLQGRRWERGVGSRDVSDGNVYLTVCLPLEAVPSTITLLPLQVAVIVAQRMRKLLIACGATDPSLVRVKWPNDVLLAEQKVSGTLIENEVVGGKTWMLVGIGINVLTSPNSILGKRRAVSLQEHCGETISSDTASALGKDIAIAMADWLAENREGHCDADILRNWRELADLGKLYELRGAVVDEQGFEGERVTVLDVENDGRLRVRGEDGQTRLLAAEYLV